MNSTLFFALATVPFCAAVYGADSPIFRGEYWKAEGAVYGDGRVSSEECRKTPEKAPHGHILDYSIEVPESGWYAPFFKNGSLEQDYIVDGEIAGMFALSGRLDSDGFSQGLSLWLEKGAHKLRFMRFGRRSFPTKKFDFFELRPLKADRAAQCVFAEVDGHDVVRLGEDLVLAVKAGNPFAAVRYEVQFAVQRDAKREDAWKSAATLDFPKSGAPAVKRAAVRLPAEGMYFLRLVSDGKELPSGVFPRREVVCVDVGGVSAAEQDVSPGASQTVCEIDCAATAPDAEANGPTRVTRCDGLVYRESHDCSKEVSGPYDGNMPENLSCFSYKVKVPEAQVPYLLEVEFPDNERRSVCVRHDWFEPGTDRYLKMNYGYQTKSWETGGFFSVSGGMKQQGQIIWPLSTEGRVTIINQSAGTRAACAKIRISKVAAPVAKPPVANRRIFSYWSEEGDSFAIMIGAQQLVNSAYLAAVERWLQMIRFYGGNAVSGVGVAYQGAFWRSRALASVGIPQYSQLRLFALLAEKYGMAFIPEWFLYQDAQHNVLFPQLAPGGREEALSKNASGTLAGGGVNPLCPVVQDTYVAAMKEIFDEIGDSPAFKGLTVRADPWQFRSQFFFKSLYWGYNESVVRDFERETGVKVPPGDAAAYFAFLTSPAVKDRWVRWRCDRISAYQTRVLDALRGGGRRPDVFFGMVGQFDQENLYRKAPTIAERALESGVDLARIKASDGFSVVPIARYGTGTPSKHDRAIYDELFQTESADAAMGSPRAFAVYMNYMELATDWPAKELGFDLSACGGQVPYHCSGVNAAGRNALERYAVPLAESDVAYIRDGGNADCLPSPDILRPWLDEYERLPSVPFDRAPGANDPVAVWHKATSDGSYWWYAVNKERFAVTATVVFGDGSEERVALEPFGLKVFCEKGARRIASVACEYPEQERAKVRELLARAQSISGEVADSAFDAGVAKAWRAAESGKWWRARVELETAPMYGGYEKEGHLPEEVLRVMFPDKLDLNTPKNGHWNLCTPTIAAGRLEAGGGFVLRRSSEINQNWRGEQVLWGDGGSVSFMLDAPAEGRYDLVLGVVSEEKGVATAEVNGRLLPGVCSFPAASEPVTAAFHDIALQRGKVEVKIRGTAALGVYGVRFLPVMRPVPGADWAIAGPYEAYWGTLAKMGCGDDALKAGFDDIEKTNLASCKWRIAAPGVEDALWDRGAHMALRIASTGGQRSIIRTTVSSDRDRTATLIVAVDWWARVRLNGEMVKTDVSGGGSEENGCNFWGWYPMWTGVVNLKKGDNDLVIYQNGGSLGSAFAAWITDDEGVRTKLP